MSQKPETFQMSMTSYSTRKSGINIVFYSSFTGIFAFGVLLASTILVEWRIEIPTISGQQAIKHGLFQVCKESPPTLFTNDDCLSSSTFTQQGSVLSSSENDLEQATKGMMIISIVFSLLSNVLSVVLGINRLARRRGYIYSSITHFLTMIFVLSANITYTLLLQSLSAQTPRATFILPGLSYYISWFPLVLHLVSTMLCLIGGLNSKRLQ